VVRHLFDAIDADAVTRQRTDAVTIVTFDGEYDLEAERYMPIPSVVGRGCQLPARAGQMVGIELIADRPSFVR